MDNGKPVSSSRVRDALRETERVGLGQLTMRGREYLCAIRPCGDGLLLETLHYADEIRDAEPMFTGIEDDPSDEDLLAVATQLIERKTAPFDAAAFKDRYDEALRTLLEEKTKSRKTKRVTREGADTARPQGENVIDLMDALKKSLNADVGEKPARSRSSTKTPAAKTPAAKKPAAKTRATRAPAKSTRTRKSA